MYVYFIGYTFAAGGNVGAGSCEFVTPDPVETIERIYAIEDDIIVSQGFDKVTVTGCSLLREE